MEVHLAPLPKLKLILKKKNKLLEVNNNGGFLHFPVLCLSGPSWALPTWFFLRKEVAKLLKDQVVNIAGFLGHMATVQCFNFAGVA